MENEYILNKYALIFNEEISKLTEEEIISKYSENAFCKVLMEYMNDIKVSPITHLFGIKLKKMENIVCYQSNNMIYYCLCHYITYSNPKTFVLSTKKMSSNRMNGCNGIVGIIISRRDYKKLKENNMDIVMAYTSYYDQKLIMDEHKKYYFDDYIFITYTNIPFIVAHMQSTAFINTRNNSKSKEVKKIIQLLKHYLYDDLINLCCSYSGFRDEHYYESNGGRYTRYAEFDTNNHDIYLVEYLFDDTKEYDDIILLKNSYGFISKSKMYKLLPTSNFTSKY